MLVHLHVLSLEVLEMFQFNVILEVYIKGYLGDLIFIHIAKQNVLKLI
jgi:hypothetical protein